MLVLDAKTTFLDDDGKPLSGGRLRYFAFATTTPVSVYADDDYVTPLGPVVALTSAGWTSTGIYAQQSVTVHVDRYLGMDDFGEESYEEIKVYNYLTSASVGGGSADSGIVDTIEDLRSVTPVDGLSITVKGYYNAFDCFPRTYIYDSDSTALENLGTVIESSIDPLGRWLHVIEGPYVDCRIFGITAGSSPSTTNSAFAQWLMYTQTTQKTAYLPSGHFYLTSGGSITTSCAMKIDEDAKIFSTSGSYTLNLSNPQLTIANTFAGTGLQVVLNGDGFEQTTIPITAFDSIEKGYDIGTARFNLLINASGYSWTHNATYNNIILGDDTYSVDFGSYIIICNELKGTGKLTLNTEANLSCNVLHTKNLTGLITKATSLTKEHLIVDSDVELGTIDIPVWDTIYNPRMTVSANLASYSQVKIPYRFSCTNNALSGSLFDFGVQQLNPYWFSSNHSLVNSINVSSFEYLDLQGASLSIPLGRGLTLKNGTVYRLQDNCTLINVTVTDRYLGNYVNATDCVFQGSMPNINSSKMTRVNIQGTTGSMGAINGQNSVWTEVTVPRQVKVLGGSARWTNVMAGEVICIPDNDFGNFMWYGGSATEVVFDAVNKSSTTNSICFNTHIQNVINLLNGISSINGSTKKWAFEGHYNVRIGNNERGRATFGTKSFSVTSVSSGVVTNLENKVLLFNNGGANEYVNTSTAHGQFYSTTGEAKGYEAYAANSPIRYSATKQIFQLYKGDNYLTNPTVGDKLWITFEVYK